jgi:UDP-N-acetylglucosamine 1-carboxyvinyltransferase
MSSVVVPPRVVCERSGPLAGEVVVPGAKNSVLKLMAATLLADGRHTLTNVPAIADVGIMADLLGAIGVDASPDPDDPTIWHLDHGGVVEPVAPYDLAERIRASINVLGPLLARYGEVTLTLPGGDDFGSRPIDMHIAGLEAMGATFDVDPASGVVIGRAHRLHGADVTLEFPSVGATENIVTAAVVAKGTTVLDNAAKEPEIVDLCEFLIAMGAGIDGVGTSRLVVHGVERDALAPAVHRTVSDRIQAATYLAAAAVTRGEVFLRGARADHMETLLRRLREMGIELVAQHDGLTVRAPERLRSVDISTLPYPGIATDYKPLITTMLTIAEGTGIVTENLYPGRFRYVEELRRMGADITTDGHHAVVRGRGELHGAAVVAPDIRAGAALVVAGLCAHGTTTISEIHHIDRGYDDLVGRLAALGASIRRV